MGNLDENYWQFGQYSKIKFKLTECYKASTIFIYRKEQLIHLLWFCSLYNVLEYFVEIFSVKLSIFTIELRMQKEWKLVTQFQLKICFNLTMNKTLTNSIFGSLNFIRKSVCNKYSLKSITSSDSWKEKLW